MENKMTKLKTISDIENMTVKEFMEWFVSQYEGAYLPSDVDATIYRLDGYCMAKGTEATLHHAALNHLRNFKTLLDMLKISGWKYKG